MLVLHKDVIRPSTHRDFFKIRDNDSAINAEKKV